MKIMHEQSSTDQHVTFSAGAIIQTPRNNDFESALKSADKLLYEAMNSGRNKVLIESLDSGNEVFRRQQLNQ
jgi:PleD family two-component response regulator